MREGSKPHLQHLRPLPSPILTPTLTLMLSHLQHLQPLPTLTLTLTPTLTRAHPHLQHLQPLPTLTLTLTPILTRAHPHLQHLQPLLGLHVAADVHLGYNVDGMHGLGRKGEQHLRAGGAGWRMWVSAHMGGGAEGSDPTLTWLHY